MTNNSIEGLLSNGQGGQAASVEVPAGVAVAAYCFYLQPGPNVNSDAVGTVQFANGQEFSFSGIWK